MARRETAVPGAHIRVIKGIKYVVIDIRKMFPEGAPTVHGLADKLGLPSEHVFNEIFHFKSNVHQIKTWYLEYIGEPYPGLGKARRELKKFGYGYTISEEPSGIQRFIIKTDWVYWSVNPSRNKLLTFTLSSKFKDVLKRAKTERRRQARISAITPNMDALKDQLMKIEIETAGLDGAIYTFNDCIKFHSKEVALLEAMSGLLNAMILYPKEEWDFDDRHEVEELQKLLSKLKDEAIEHLIADPPDIFLPGAKEQRDDCSTLLLELIEDPAFLDNIRIFVDNLDIVPTQLYDLVYQTAPFIYKVLLASPKAEIVLENHVEELLNYLAGQSQDMSGCNTPNYPHFNEWLHNAPAIPEPATLLSILGGHAALISTQLIGNVPGPFSLSVSVFHFALPLLMQKAVVAEGSLGVMYAAKYGARLFRALVWISELNIHDKRLIVYGIKDGKIADLKKVDYTQHVMSRAGWGGFFAILSGICLFVAVRTDDENTLRYWSNILASAIGTALGLSVMVSRMSNLINMKIVKGLGGKALGIIGGLAAITSGAVTAYEEYELEDDIGLGLAAGTVLSGTLSVAGFLIASGILSAPTGFGVGLMAAGMAIAAGVTVISFVRGLTTDSTHLMFEAAIEFFGRSDGPYAKAAEFHPTLKKAFEDVQEAHHPGFMGYMQYVHPDRIPELSDLGFKKSHIVRIVDESVVFVHRRLLETDRSTD